MLSFVESHESVLGSRWSLSSTKPITARWHEPAGGHQHMSLNTGELEAAMPDVRVTCINKPDRNSQHEHITHLGGAGWRWTRDQVIESIEQKTNTFYVPDGTTGKR